MKMINLLLCIMGLMFPVGDLFARYEPSRHTTLANQVLKQSGDRIVKKYGLTPVGTGLSMPGGPIRKVSLSFQARGPLSKEDLRRLLVGAANEILTTVEGIPEIQSYLYSPPFTIDNIDVAIFVVDRDRREVFAPEISTSQIGYRGLEYLTVDRQNHYGYKDRYSESYEEALAALGEESKKIITPGHQDDFPIIEDDSRIAQLLPNLVAPFSIEPAIPDNFVAMSPNGELDPCDWIYWGPKDVLEAYFNNPRTLSAPILRVKVTANVGQTLPGRFDAEFMKQVNALKKQSPKTFSSRELHWGDYPVYAVQHSIGGKTGVLAWVGLNDRGSGVTLVFNLVYPERYKSPPKDAIALWNTFLEQTK